MTRKRSEGKTPGAEPSGDGAPALRLGCAGWSLPSAAAADFPTEGSHLERYAEVFPAVEINSSFYRPHRPSTYARWRDSVPADFRFSAKLPRSITHEQRLQDVEALLNGFLAEAGELRDKLGCLLVQLPPSLVFDPGVADAFFALLRHRADCALACEARHASWFSDEAAALLTQHRVASVEADPPPVAQARPQGESDIAYLRLHGEPKIYYSAYEDAQLDEIASAVRGHRARHKTVWCIFDNTAQGHAVPNALRLRAALGMDHADASP